MTATNLCTAFPWEWGDDDVQSNDSIPDYDNGTNGSSEEMIFEIDFIFNLANSTDNGAMANGTAVDYDGSSEEFVEVNIIIEEQEDH